MFLLPAPVPPIEQVAAISSLRPMHLEEQACDDAGLWNDILGRFPEPCSGRKLQVRGTAQELPRRDHEETIVRSGDKNGMLARPEEMGDLSRNLLHLLDHPEIRRCSGKNGRTEAEGRYICRAAGERYE